MDYWAECVSEALDAAGLSATDEQQETIADFIRGAHDNYGMAHGHDCIPNPLRLENEELKKKLNAEMDKRVCPECTGSGHRVSQGPYHSSISQCDRCRGEGKV